MQDKDLIKGKMKRTKHKCAANARSNGKGRKSGKGHGHHERERASAYGRGGRKPGQDSEEKPAISISRKAGERGNAR